jgi:hypothetical protein
VEQALDKKAENARELGLDYAPVLKDNSNYRYDPPVAEPVAYLCENAVGHKYFRWKKPSSTFKPIALYTTPPAAAVLEGRDWSLLEATQESLREHMAEIKRLKEAQPAPVQEPSGFFRHEDVCGDEVGPPTPYYLTPPAAQPAVPDAIIEAGESPEFRDGWNECRETMLQMLKARSA